MKIHCLAITRYKECPVTIMQFGRTFLYMFVHNEQFYFEHHTAPTNLLNLIKWLVGKWKYPYSKEEIIKIKEIMLNGAITSINKLNEV